MRFNNKNKSKLGLILLIFGIILVIDELFSGLFLPDLSAFDGYNPYLHHWMLGFILIGIGVWLYEYKI